MVDCRSFLASAALIAGLESIKEEHELQGGEVLRLEPGDIIVLRCPGHMTTEHAERLRADVLRVFHEKYEVMVLSEGLGVSILRP